MAESTTEATGDLFILGDLLRQILHLLDSLTADELYNQVVYLQRFKR